MWDRYINGNIKDAEEYYAKLSIPYHKYKTGATGYIKFLKDMQNKYANIKKGYHGRSLAKCIDENNYIIITKRIQPLEEKKKKEKKEKERLNKIFGSTPLMD